MKRIIFLLLAFMLTVTTVHASPLKSIHEFIRDTPFPQEEHTIFFNPTPLIVPLEMKKSDFLQFNLSPDKNFTGEGTLLSEPLAWNMFNPHRELKRGSETAIPASCFSGTLYPADRSHGRDKPSSRCQVHKPGDCQT